MASEYGSEDLPSRGRRSKRRSDLYPSWLWIAVPIFIVVVVGGLWWGLFSPSNEPQKQEAPILPTATVQVIPTRVRTSTPTMVILIRSTPTPTIKPSPTVPTTITKGYRVKVVGTGGAGLNIRVAPGVDKDLVKTVEDGTILMVLEGPIEADDYQWWQVQDESGSVGWAASEWLALYLE